MLLAGTETGRTKLFKSYQQHGRYYVFRVLFNNASFTFQPSFWTRKWLVRVFFFLIPLFELRAIMSVEIKVKS